MKLLDEEKQHTSRHFLKVLLSKRQKLCYELVLLMCAEIQPCRRADCYAFSLAVTYELNRHYLGAFYLALLIQS